MGYQYRGTVHDVKPVVTDETPFDASACGTYKGYRRHLNKGVKACPGCKAANAAYLKAWREKHPKPRNPRPVGITDPKRCGTRTGYNRHRQQGTLTCAPCRDAHAEHARKFRASRREAGAGV